jgi:hypothetical protein
VAQAIALSRQALNTSLPAMELDVKQACGDLLGCTVCTPLTGDDVEITALAWWTVE